VGGFFEEAIGNEVELGFVSIAEFDVINVGPWVILHRAFFEINEEGEGLEGEFSDRQGFHREIISG
jgi:hypothetical protein